MKKIVTLIILLCTTTFSTEMASMENRKTSSIFRDLKTLKDQTKVFKKNLNDAREEFNMGEINKPWHTRKEKLYKILKKTPDNKEKLRKKIKENVDNHINTTNKKLNKIPPIGYSYQNTIYSFFKILFGTTCGSIYGLIYKKNWKEYCDIKPKKIIMCSFFGAIIGTYSNKFLSCLTVATIQCRSIFNWYEERFTQRN